MARPRKTGLDYFSVDTDRFQDIRIKRLKKAFGCNGFSVYEYLLNEVYRVKGCFMEWDESTVFDVAEYWGLKETTVKEIVRYCGAVGLFNKELLSDGIITSKSIQSRYLYMCEKSKRRELIIPEEIRLIPEETELTPEETQLNPPKTPYIKIKESKGNNIRDNNARAKGIFGENGYAIWKENILKNLNISEDQFYQFSKKFEEEAACRNWRIGGSDCRSLFYTWLSNLIQKQKENEIKRKDRFEQRRGTETNAHGAEDYDEPL